MTRLTKFIPKSTTGLFLSFGVMLTLACGGAAKSTKGTGGTGGTGGGGGKNGDITGGGNLGNTPKPKVPTRTISKNAAKDFKKAVALWKAKEKLGWTNSNCRKVGDKFADVADDHGKLVEAHFNAALAFHKCGILGDARKHYNKTLRVMSNHPGAISGLAEIAFQKGNVNEARNKWKKALNLDGKLIGARNNLAYLALLELRKTKSRDRWKTLAKDIKFNLSSSLAVDNDNVRTYVLYGLFFLEGSKRNRSRLDLAKLLMDEGAKRNANYAPLHNARGLYHMRRGNLGLALKSFMKAVSMDPKFYEARMNVGNMSLGFRKYDTAETQFAAVLKSQPKNYDAVVGLGVAQRGMGKISNAESSYNRAMKLDSSRGEAYFNMAVLYKDFRASKATQVDKVMGLYKTSLKYFRQFRTKKGITKASKAETDESVEKIQKTLKSLEGVKKALEMQKKLNKNKKK